MYTTQPTVPHVVVVVGLECFNDLWDNAVEPLMSDRSKIKFQTKKDTYGLRRVQVIEVHFAGVI